MTVAPRFPDPAERYERHNEAQFRREVERALGLLGSGVDTVTAASGASTKIKPGYHHPVLPVVGSGNVSWHGVFQGPSTSTLSLSRRTFTAVPFVPALDMAVDRMALRVTTGATQASTVARMALYASGTGPGGDFLPTTLLAETAEFSVDTTGVKDQALGSTVQLTAGELYWMAHIHDHATLASTVVYRSGVPTIALGSSTATNGVDGTVLGRWSYANISVTIIGGSMPDPSPVAGGTNGGPAGNVLAMAIRHDPDLL